MELFCTGQKQYDYGNLTVLGLPNRPGGAFGGRHVIAETELNENFFKRNVWSARTYGEITFLKDLNLLLISALMLPTG